MADFTSLQLKAFAACVPEAVKAAMATWSGNAPAPSREFSTGISTSALCGFGAEQDMQNFHFVTLNVTSLCNISVGRSEASGP